MVRLNTGGQTLRVVVVVCVLAWCVQLAADASLYPRPPTPRRSHTRGSLCPVSTLQRPSLSPWEVSASWLAGCCNEPMPGDRVVVSSERTMQMDGCSADANGARAVGLGVQASRVERCSADSATGAWLVDASRGEARRKRARGEAYRGWESQRTVRAMSYVATLHTFSTPRWTRHLGSTAKDHS